MMYLKKPLKTIHYSASTLPTVRPECSKTMLVSCSRVAQAYSMQLMCHIPACRLTCRKRSGINCDVCEPECPNEAISMGPRILTIATATTALHS
ncbi:hypothetical protein F7R19_10065 [Cupriavidus pauculus]|nr:hypothetical protein F7R19_10065 [Cupriavidus pauculus]